MRWRWLWGWELTQNRVKGVTIGDLKKNKTCLFIWVVDFYCSAQIPLRSTFPYTSFLPLNIHATFNQNVLSFSFEIYFSIFILDVFFFVPTIHCFCILFFFNFKCNWIVKGLMYSLCRFPSLFLSLSRGVTCSTKLRESFECNVRSSFPQNS